MLGDKTGWGEIKLISFIPRRQGICESIDLPSFLTYVGLCFMQILWLDFGGGSQFRMQAGPSTRRLWVIQNHKNLLKTQN